MIVVTFVVGCCLVAGGILWAGYAEKPCKKCYWYQCELKRCLQSVNCISSCRWFRSRDNLW
jgi:hypothetical protein